MKFKVDVLFAGFSGRISNGRLGWGTTALIRDDKHRILMDTGGMTIRCNIKDLLSQHQVQCEDIDYVLLSHLHSDHVYNIDLFPQAKFVLSLREWEHAGNMLKRDYSIGENAIPLLRSFKKHLVTEDEEEIVPGITTLLTPGHTPGCLSFVLHQDDQRWVLVGDAVKNRGELRNEEVQQTCCMNDSIESIRKVKAIADRVLPGHDGWLTIRDGEVIPEGGNDITFLFSQGIKVNGKSFITLRME